MQTQNINALLLEYLGSIDHPELTFKELEHIYHLALNKLPEKQREIFLMSREEGLSQKQIAEKKNISTSTVNNHITAAMKIIRIDMGEYSEALSLIMLAVSCSLS